MICPILRPSNSIALESYDSHVIWFRRSPQDGGASLSNEMGNRAIRVTEEITVGRAPTARLHRIFLASAGNRRPAGGTFHSPSPTARLICAALRDGFGRPTTSAPKAGGR
jgi:hypothetical protein